ncbi:polysaccharide lyase family 8 super-sandwich domain-containing protein [Bacteroides gallinarum]|uniref:polysaccharide lyase family 8 super-sandwich domain-containing protein n=1 Tax=Bacteroides gallinarum TaxID=376806 RepID=UPI000AB3355C|nr:polysaccharide lyase family 8 super-sandwich domain-containing protein [Bacteroides gallinarum]
MTRNKLNTWLGIILCSLLPLGIQAQEREKVFADYFDIPVNSPEGTEVIGRIHLERNKDVSTRPIPESYRFEILEQDAANLFTLETRYDLSKRIMGVFTVAEGKKTEAEKASHRLVVALKDGDRQLRKFKVTIRVAKEPLLKTLYNRYLPEVINNDRMYGRTKFTNDEVAGKIIELKRNGWKFEGLEKCYERRPQDYLYKVNANDDHRPTGTIEYDWEKVVNQIGGLGHAYANSNVYGPQGNPAKHRELRETLYHTILTFTSSVPVEGSELLIDGKPIGNCTGDGFALLQSRKMAGMQVSTHQWMIVDGLVGPAVHLMPDLLKGMQNGDSICEKVHNALIRYLQVFFAEIKGRRAIDNPAGRWGELQDTVYSAGAWADANLGHRIRTMLALPFIWADYNRPLTYVQYWYEDFYKGKPFKGFSYSTGWSPHGIMSDLSYWMTKYNVVAHKYIQSGFQPDGTVSHHIANATDAAMVAYGFGWLTDCNVGYNYFRNTRYSVPAQYYQFQADRLLNVYPRMFYKQRMDFLVAGRSFLDNLQDFAVKTYPRSVNSMLKARSKNTRIEGVEELKAVCRQVRENTFEYSGTDAYWVNEYLVHRRGQNEAPFYASLKLKSERTVGAEDFGKKVRRSWHMGYGILPVKVTGDEYSEKVICNFDWHALPGLTEEWRTDPMPMKGGSQGSLPGSTRLPA